MFLLLAQIKMSLRSEKGQGMVEYGLILSMISIAAILILPNVGTEIVGVMNRVVTALTPAG